MTREQRSAQAAETEWAEIHAKFCPECGGNGFTYDIGTDGEADTERQIMCPKCGGTGLAPVNARQSQAAGIAGLSFLACILLVPLAYLSTLFRVYAPPLRDWLLVQGDVLRELLGVLA